MSSFGPLLPCPMCLLHTRASCCAGLGGWELRCFEPRGSSLTQAVDARVQPSSGVLLLPTCLLPSLRYGLVSRMVRRIWTHAGAACAERSQGTATTRDTSAQGACCHQPVPTLSYDRRSTLLMAGGCCAGSACARTLRRACPAYAHTAWKRLCTLAATTAAAAAVCDVVDGPAASSAGCTP